jgi:hypothetical protein
VWNAEESAAGREGARRSEKAKMPEDGGLINQAIIGLKPVNACVHTYTKPQTSSTRSRGLGWGIHGSVEDTKLSTNKQHTLSQRRQTWIDQEDSSIFGKRDSLFWGTTNHYSIP